MGKANELHCEAFLDVKTTSISGSWRLGSTWQKCFCMFGFWYSSLEYLFWPLSGPRGLWSALAQTRDMGWDVGDMDCGVPLLSSGGRKFAFWWTESDCHVTKECSPSLLRLKAALVFKSAFHYFRPFSQIRYLKWRHQWITLYQKYTFQLRWINVKQHRNQ